MGVNKVDLSNGETLIDLTNDSVTPETLAKGVTAHDAKGNVIKGILDVTGDTMVGTWVFNEVLDITLQGDYYVKISKADIWTEVEIIGLTFFDQVGMGLLLDTDGNYWDYHEDNQWYLDRTITITEEPTDPELIAWIKANATKQADKDDSSNFEMPIIRFANFQDADGCMLTDENPFKFTVEILGGGALREGDKLQICVRRKYKLPDQRTKWRLRSVVSRDITSDDIGKRFLSIVVTTFDVDDGGYWLFRNDRGKRYDTYSGASIDTLSYMYFRIKRVTKYNNDGEECDAIFSNIEKVAKTYNYGLNKLTIK